MFLEPCKNSLDEIGSQGGRGATETPISMLHHDRFVIKNIFLTHFEIVETCSKEAAFSSNDVKLLQASNGFLEFFRRADEMTEIRP